MRLETDDYYSTSDFALAATISLWHPIDAIDKSNPRKSQFIFKRDDGLDKLIGAFWKNELKVNPLAYFNQLKAIKARLYEENGNGKPRTFR